jgi:hypothetical protein
VVWISCRAGSAPGSCSALAPSARRRAPRAGPRPAR